MQVPLVRTVPSIRDFARAFIRAWRALYPDYPTQAQCGVLYAQWQVETGGSACWCWNIGNVKVTPAQVDADVPWFDLPGTWEIVHGKKVVLQAGDHGRRFRAYSSLDDAMRSHLTFLRNHRYKPSWPFVESGDPDGFARALKRQGYYTAPADAYAGLMVRFHADFLRSKAFGDALEEVIEASEAETKPSMPVPDFAIVHPPVSLEHDPFAEPGPGLAPDPCETAPSVDGPESEKA